MALDGIFLSAVVRELQNKIVGAKVEKITQPERDEIILHLHSPQLTEEKHIKLTVSVNPSHPMVYLSSENRENPLVAPNFCMLLRKHLSSSRILSVTQAGFDRIIIIDFESKTEMYETVRRRLIVEIMGRFSNIIFTDGNGVIYDAVKQIDFSLSAKRQILPQFVYELPPKQDRADIVLSPDFIYDFSSEERADKVICSYYTGFSPLISRELVFIATGKTDTLLKDFSEEAKYRLQKAISEASEKIKNGDFSFSVIKRDSPIDFYCLPISQYGDYADKQECRGPSETVERFFSEKMRNERIKRHSSDITKAVNTAINRAARKIEARESDLKNCENAEEYRRYGDALFASLNAVKQGEKFARVTDYSSESVSEMTVPLEPSLSPVKNAQRYYKLYKKAQTAKEMLKKELPAAREELKYLESVKTSLETAENIVDLSEIKEELLKEGYIRNNSKTKQNRKSKTPSFKPAVFFTSENIPVYVGKNNLQNDWLTTKFADKNDIWFHVKNYPGSHTILACSGKEYGDASLNEAAVIAATFSGASDGAKIEVDYVAVKNVKKPSGAKPGMVIYDGYKTAVVSADCKTAERLRAKNV